MFQGEIVRFLHIINGVHYSYSCGSSLVFHSLHVSHHCEAVWCEPSPARDGMMVPSIMLHANLSALLNVQYIIDSGAKD